MKIINLITKSSSRINLRKEWLILYVKSLFISLVLITLLTLGNFVSSAIDVTGKSVNSYHRTLKRKVLAVTRLANFANVGLPAGKNYANPVFQ